MRIACEVGGPVAGGRGGVASRDEDVDGNASAAIGSGMTDVGEIGSGSTGDAERCDEDEKGW